MMRVPAAEEGAATLTGGGPAAMLLSQLTGGSAAPESAAAASSDAIWAGVPGLSLQDGEVSAADAFAAAAAEPAAAAGAAHAVGTNPDHEKGLLRLLCVPLKSSIFLEKQPDLQRLSPLRAAEMLTQSHYLWRCSGTKSP